MRYEIWKNGKLVSECQRRTTAVARMLRMKYNKEVDMIWVVDTRNWESKDIEYFLPL